MEKKIEIKPFLEDESEKTAAFVKGWYDLLEKWLLDDDAYGRPRLSIREIDFLGRQAELKRPIFASIFKPEVRDALLSLFIQYARYHENNPLTDYGIYYQAIKVFADDKKALEKIAHQLAPDPQYDFEQVSCEVKAESWFSNLESEEVALVLFNRLWKRRAKRYLEYYIQNEAINEALAALEEERPVDVSVDLDGVLTEVFELTFSQTMNDYFQATSKSDLGMKSKLEAKVLWRTPEVFPQNAKKNRVALLRALKAMEGGEDSFDYQRLMNQGEKSSGQAIFAMIDQGIPPQNSPYYILNNFGRRRYFIDPETFDVYYSVGHGKTEALRAKRHGFLLA